MIQKRFDSKNPYQDTVKTMDLEQFDAIVKAIVEGRYSWACVLILRFAGYNPAHYIPYRTYKRLIKENRRRQLAEQMGQEPTVTQDSVDDAKSKDCSFSQMMHSAVLAEIENKQPSCVK